MGNPALDRDRTDLDLQKLKLRQESFPPLTDVGNVVRQKDQRQVEIHTLDRRSEVGGGDEISRAGAHGREDQIHLGEKPHQGHAVRPRQVADKEPGRLLDLHAGQTSGVGHGDPAGDHRPAGTIAAPKVGNPSGTLLGIEVHQNHLEAVVEGPLRQVEGDGGLSGTSFHGTESKGGHRQSLPEGLDAHVENTETTTTYGITECST